MKNLSLILFEYSLFFSLVLSFVMSVTLCKILIPFFFKVGFLDNPTARSNHSKSVALGGGIIIIPLILFSSFLMGYQWSRMNILILFILFLISLIDDFKNLTPFLRLITHFFCITAFLFFFFTR